jgi:uncharacterized spore protein YtfJ
MNEQFGLQEPRDRAGEFMVRMAEAIGAHAGASTVFSQPVSRNGATVVPMAQAAWGFGGGGGRKNCGAKVWAREPPLSFWWRF